MIDNSIERIVSKYRCDVENIYNEYLKDVQQVMANKNLDNRKKELVYQIFMEGVLPGHVNHKAKMIKNIRKYDTGASFKNLLANFIIEKKYMDVLEVPIAPPKNSKSKDRDIFRMSGIDCPEIYLYDVDFYESLNFLECVIKPVVGSSSKGVFVKRADKYHHVFDGRVFDANAAKEIIKKTSGTTLVLIEELVSLEAGPAKDWKFYTFYGEVSLVIEIDRSLGSPKYCFYDSLGEVTDAGIYPSEDLFVGSGVSKNAFELASKVSLTIPSPFIRVDFLSSGEEFLGGEITSNPGYFHMYSQAWDRYMGISFLRARARLFRDVLDGKNFDEYLSIMA